MPAEVRVKIEPGAPADHVRVVATFEPSVLTEAHEQSESFLNSVLRLVAVGAFGTPKGSGAAFHGSQAIQADPPREVAFSLAMPAVHPGVWRCVVGGMAARTARTIVIDDPAAHAELRWRDLLDLPRVMAARAMPFRLDVTENPNRAERLVQLVFKSPVTDAVAADVHARLTDWSALLEGGFPLPDTVPGESSAASLGTYVVDSFTIEHRIDEGDHDDEAYEVLLNIAAFVHENVAPLESILIE